MANLSRESGKSDAEFARQMGIFPNSLRNWKRLNPPPLPGSAKLGVAVENHELRQTVAQLEQERDAARQERDQIAKQIDVVRAVANYYRPM